jgi:hypothetical protein
MSQKSLGDRLVSCRAEIFIECGLYLRFRSRRIIPKIIEDKTQYDEYYEKRSRSKNTKSTVLKSSMASTVAVAPV